MPGLAHSPEAMERFLLEGRLAAALSHPRSTFVYEAGVHDGQPYIVMELMPGQTLQHISAHAGPLPVQRAVDYILDVIDGLEAAHAAGVIHRDVKPSNCFIDSNGRVKVGDFGLSKSLVNDAALTRTGAFMGTPLFAAPEQVRAGKIDERTDIYSVGATLFFLIAQRGPFIGDPAAVIAQISSDRAPSLRSLIPSVPKVLDSIIARTLEKDPARRFASIEQLRQALLPFATGGTSIADVGRRMGAYMFDSASYGLLVGMAYGMTAAILGATRSITLTSDTKVLLITALAGWLAQIGYFAVAEGLWGRGLGKWLLGLRVVGMTGETPGLARTLLRSFFIPGGLGVTFALIFLSSLAESRSLFADKSPNAVQLRTSFMGLLVYVPILLCLVTMRRQNGYRGVHEIVSGTRVVRWSTGTEERRLQNVPIVEPVVTAGSARQFGPFHEIGMLGQSDQSTVLVARDDTLHRPVWVYVSPQEWDGLTNIRIGISRPTRQRWLQGGQEASSHWGAFESISGSPLQQAVGPNGLSWELGRLVLRDLADELRVAAVDGTLPSQLTVDQVWLDHSGHVKLLDHPIRVGNAKDSPKNVAQVSNTTTPATQAVSLLQAAANLCTRGQMLPGHAQEFLQSLANRPGTPETLEWAANQLRELSERKAELRWDDRLGILGVTMGVEYTFYWTTAMILAMASWSWFDTITHKLQVPLAFTLFAPLVLGGWFRGGPVFWFLGIEVRRRDGKPAGALRCALRSAIAWIPLTLFSAFMPMFAYVGSRDWQKEKLSLAEGILLLIGGGSSCLMMVSIFFLIYTVMRPKRGIQDLLVGTCLVPR